MTKPESTRFTASSIAHKYNQYSNKYIEYISYRLEWFQKSLAFAFVFVLVFLTGANTGHSPVDLRAIPIWANFTQMVQNHLGKGRTGFVTVYLND